MASIGTMRNSSQVRTLALSMGALFGVGANGVIASYYGYPTCPRIPIGDSTGSHRLPPTVDLTWAGHPAFWLPKSSRFMQPGENEQQFNIRIYLDLVLRGYFADPEGENGQFAVYSVFDLEGIDMQDPTMQHSLRAYLRGEPDNYFDKLSLIPDDIIEIGRQQNLHKEAEIQYLKSELGWHYWFAIDDDRHYEALSSTADLLGKLDIQELMEPWYQYTTDWDNDPHGPDRKNQANELLLQYKTGINRVYDHLRHLETFSEPVPTPISIQQVENVHSAARLERDKILEAATTSIYQTGDAHMVDIGNTLYKWLYDAKMKSIQLLTEPFWLDYVTQRRAVRMELIEALETNLADLGYSLQADLERDASEYPR